MAMARPLRVEYPGAFYHVISRGNAGAAVFITERDREKFLEYLQKAHARFSLLIHSYCLMDNHYHLLIETPQANLSQSIQWINVSYAAYFNKKHGRNGHLFQGRFKAILIDADEYLNQLSRYIHLNPVKAKLSSSPDTYAWSSYGALVGSAACPDFLAAERILSGFGGSHKEAVKRYRKYVEGVDIKSLEDPLQSAIGSFVLGDSHFVQWVKDTFLSLREDQQEIPQLKELKPRRTLDDIVEAIAREYHCPEESIRTRGRKNNLPREVAIYLAKEMSGKSGLEVGRYFGGVSGALITMTANRLARQMSSDKDLAGRIRRMKRRIFNI
jgi:REP element-mobilizing transposase RayT